MPQKFLISIVGPTALGKTRLAIELARHYDTSVISSDARQFYKEMRIGTAVPSGEELKQATHHFIQHISIHDTYTVGKFERDAIEFLEALYRNKNFVVMAGGSGLYIKAVTEGLDHFPPVDAGIRKSLNDRLRDEGLESLQKELQKLDPAYYSEVDLKNPHRVIRALEVCVSSGKPYSTYRKDRKVPRDFKTITIGLEADRPVLYERIEKRVDRMMEAGLLEEARTLLPFRHLNALQTVGYKELFEYLDGECELDTAVAEIKKNTRRFAKRQLTWFRKQEAIHWVNFRESTGAVIELIENRIHG